MTDDFNDREERRRDLAAFANAGGQLQQPTPGGHALVRPTTAITDRVIGSQPVTRPRDQAKVLQDIAALAAAAGDDWFYRYPVRKQGGGQDFIQGPSIKLANDVARIFGNDAIEVREIDVGDAWTFYARFTDIETGFSMERAYRQRKSQTSMRTGGERQLDIAYQIGQSKAIRNVICNALQIYCDFAYEQAQNSLVNKIGKDMEASRERIIGRLKEIDVPLARAERAVGRVAKDWLAPDIARLAAMWKGIADGMASAEETFPLPQPTPAAAASSPADTATTSPVSAADGGTEASPASGGTALGAGPSPATATTGIDAAYQQGKQARAAGHSRKAMPGGYRDHAHTREAVAWDAGWNGSEQPTFTQEG